MRRKLSRVGSVPQLSLQPRMFPSKAQEIDSKEAKLFPRKKQRRTSAEQIVVWLTRPAG